jgi:hypothetical protein
MLSAMRSIGSLLFCSFACTLSAQPVIHADNAPMAGTTFTMHAGTYFNLPQTGPGQTWDYSIVGGGGGFSYVFDHASGDPQAESFPNADLVRTGDGNSYFHSTSEEGVFFHGHISDFGNLFLDVPRQDLVYPLTFGTTWNDDFSGVLGSQPITGSNSCVADGTGALILPWGTIDDVIRVKCRMVATIPGASVEHVDTLTFFHRAGFPWHLLRARKRVTFQNGQPMPQNLELEYASEASVVSIAEPSMRRGQMTVFPSPAQDLIHIRSPLLLKALGITIFDGQGRVMRSEGLTGSNPVEIRLNIADLPSGVYVLHLITGDEDPVQPERFMVLH